jgi:uncharacterized membrane protein
LHWLFLVLPHSLPAGNWYLDLRPGVVVPLAAGLLAGPGAGVVVGGVGRLGGDLLAGAGVDGPGLIYSALLGLVAGLGRRPRANYRTLAALAWALLWVLIAAIAAGLFVPVLIEATLLGRLALPAAWARAGSEILSGAVAGLLLMPGVLVGVGLRK